MTHNTSEAEQELFPDVRSPMPGAAMWLSESPCICDSNSPRLAVYTSEGLDKGPTASVSPRMVVLTLDHFAHQGNI